MAADWPSLPRDLLALIIDKLFTVDCIRFGAVCRAWRDALTDRRRRQLPLRSPWLLVLPDNGNPSAATFFDLSLNKLHTIDLQSPPDIHRHILIGSGDGWLITADEMSELHAINPITKNHLLLPSITTLPTVKAVRDADGLVLHYLFYNWIESNFSEEPIRPEDLRHLVYSKANIVSNCNRDCSSLAFTDDGWTAFIILGPESKLAFARLGDSAWTVLDRICSVEEFVFYKGKIYTISISGLVRVWDFNTLTPLIKNLPWSADDDMFYYEKYLVVSEDDLLLVCRAQDDGLDSRAEITTCFSTFKLSANGSEWIFLENIGDQALFLGLNGSFSISVKNFPGLKCNSIYFTNSEREVWAMPDDLLDTGVYYLEDGRIEFLSSLILSNKSWPLSIWLLPSLY